jgi:hypothetical protein
MTRCGADAHPPPTHTVHVPGDECDASSSSVCVILAMAAELSVYKDDLGCHEGREWVSNIVG